MKKLITIFLWAILGICLISAKTSETCSDTYLSQCSEEYLDDYGWNPDGSPWFAYCKDCEEYTEYYNCDTGETERLEYNGPVSDCHYVGRL